jgi:hypothetical protein
VILPNGFFLLGTLCFLGEVWDVEVVENKLEATRWDGKGWESEKKKKKVGEKNKGKVGVLLGELKKTTSAFGAKSGGVNWVWFTQGGLIKWKPWLFKQVIKVWKPNP